MTSDLEAFTTLFIVILGSVWVWAYLADDLPKPQNGRKRKNDDQ